LAILKPDYKILAFSVGSFALWQQATIEITRRDHSIIACSHHIHNGVILHAHPVRGESHNQRNTAREVATVHKTKRIYHTLTCFSENAFCIKP